VTVRPVVDVFVSVGPLPADNASEDVIRHRQEQLEAITGPVTVDEARLLVGCFGPDDLYGLAWTLLHLVETARQPVLLQAPPGDANQFLRLLWARQQRA
jgi:hypothetical protein